MSLLPRKGLLAIVAVVDIALQGGRPVSARALAGHHGLPTRHLEPILQALVHDGILKGLRGPRGGYYLGRERRKITVDDIIRAVGGHNDDMELWGSTLVAKVVLPAVSEAERAFTSALAQINVEDLASRAQTCARAAS
jgi:Rrf2 family protein